MVGVLVVDAQAAAHVDVAHRAAAALQARDQLVDAVAQRREIHHVQDLRSDVEMQAAVADVRQAQRQVHDLVELLVVDAELVLRQAGGDAGVRVRSDVGIDAQAHGRHDAHFARQGVDHLQLGRRLDVEAGDAGLQGDADLRVALADAREHDALRGEPRRQGGEHFAAAHAVGAEAPRRDLRQDPRVVVGLDGVVHAEVRVAVELGLHRIQRPPQQRQVVIVERRPHRGETLNREFALQHYSNRHLLKERRARALSSPFTRKEML